MILVKKLKFFHLLYLSKIDGEKVFADVLDNKEAFKDYKKNKPLKTIKRRQNWHFCKGDSPRFWSKR